LKNINLDVQKGEILGIVGVNGSGKSTLLEIVSGILTPSSGSVQTKGRIVALIQLGSGFNPEFTGLENIYFYSSVMGFSKNEIDEKLNDILEFAEIDQFIYQPLKSYSSGMRARLAFAVSVNINPDILILDEVLSVGDELFRRKSFAKMEEFFLSGKTILFVSHAMNNINELCTRAICLDRGELILEGPPKMVTTHYLKYLFTSPKNKKEFRNAIIELNSDEYQKKSYLKPLTNDVTNDVKRIEKVHSNKMMFKEIKYHEQEAFYLPEFKPKSTVQLKNYDVDIKDIYLKNREREKVNAIVMNDEYIFSYRIKFGIDAIQVATGIGFKTEKGLLISNANLHYNRIEKVKKGTEYLIECCFKCIFMPGTYFINIGINSIENGERKVLNGINDAAVFKVLPVKELQYAGLVHCGQKINIRKLV